jgi:hypothetical protein
MKSDSLLTLSSKLSYHPNDSMTTSLTDISNLQMNLKQTCSCSTCTCSNNDSAINPN